MTSNNACHVVFPLDIDPKAPSNPDHNISFCQIKNRRKMPLPLEKDSGNGDAGEKQEDYKETKEPKKTLRSITHQFLTTTNLHGISQVPNTNDLGLKLIWVILFCAGLCALFIHIRLQVLKYHDYPVQTTLQLKNSDSLTFPAVTICNANPLKRSILWCGKSERNNLLLALDSIPTEKLKEAVKTGLLWSGESLQSLKKPTYASFDPKICVKHKLWTDAELKEYEDKIAQKMAGPPAIKKVHKREQQNKLQKHQVKHDVKGKHQKYKRQATENYEYFYDSSGEENSGDIFAKYGNTAASDSGSGYGTDEYSSSASGYGSESPSSQEPSTEGYGSSTTDGFSYTTDYWSGSGSTDNYDDYYGGSGWVEMGEDTNPEMGHTDVGERGTMSFSDKSILDKTNFTALLANSSNIFASFLDLSATSDLSDIRELSLQLTEPMSEAGYTANDLIVQCSFDQQPCYAENFTRVINRQYGNCYTFNAAFDFGMQTNETDNSTNMMEELTNSTSSDTDTTIKASFKPVIRTRNYGSDFGLRLTLDLAADEYIGLLAEEYAARVQIHNPTVLAYPERDGVSVQPGVYTGMSVEKKMFKRLPSPYDSACADKYPSEYREYLGKVQVTYNVRSCELACVDMHLHKHCDCVQQQFNALKGNNSRLCDPLDDKDRKCRRNVARRMSLSKTVKAAILCRCRAPCNEVRFEPQLSQSGWPTRQASFMRANYFYGRDRLATKLGAQASLKAMQDYTAHNLVRVQVYYRTLNYEMVTEEAAYGIWSLWADVGGIIGLYVGLSLIAVAEVFLYIFHVLQHALFIWRWL